MEDRQDSRGTQGGTSSLMGESLTEAMARVKGVVRLADYCAAEGLQQRGRESYVCPSCDSGNGKNHTAAFHLYGPELEKFKCSSCGITGDLFDLAAVIHGTDDKAEQLNYVAEKMGTEGWRNPSESMGESLGWHDVVAVINAPTPEDSGDFGALEKEDGPEVPTDHTAFYADAHSSLLASPEALDYLHKRGITDETIERFNLGYVDAWSHPKDGMHHTKRIILPRTAATYTARAMDPTERDYRDSFKKQVVGSQRDLFNLEGARGAEVVVVVEGELDAASIEQATDLAAVGLGSISNVGSFAERAKEVAPSALWLLALDNDKPKEDGRNPGHEAQEKLLASMRDAGLACRALDGSELYGKWKDANEVLVADPSRLKDALSSLVEGIKDEEYRRQMDRYHIVNTAEAVSNLYELREGRAPVPTGLEMLDRVTGGGLHAKSLHVIGAQSSEGKTTVTLQVADHVARSGHMVLFCTVEMRASELIAKSLARIAYRRSGGKTIITARGITNPKERESWGTDQWQALTDACNEYEQEVAPHIEFMDPDEPPRVTEVWGWAKIMAERYGEAPTVFVDYLQILAPEKGHERDSDKQITDRNVTLLRRMAGALNTPVWVVAALNRQSYTAPIATDSFRESSAIEYGADILLGLEPFDLETRWHNAQEKKKAMVAKGMHNKVRHAERRWMDLRVLKNRFGFLPDDGLPFVYHADADVFETMWKVRRAKRVDEEEVDGTPMGWDEDGLVM